MSSSESTTWTRGITPYLLFLVLSVTLGSLQFGYHISELNAPAKVIRCLTAPTLSIRNLPQCIPMTDTQFATVSSIYTLGGLIGALSAGPLSSKRGRLFALQVSTPLHILGAVLEATASNIPLMAFGRLLSGLGSGVALVVGPIYISEIASSEAKGILGASTQITINIGILISQVLGYFLSYGSMWRIILGTAGALGFVQLICLIFACESPEWLRTNGKVDAAQMALRAIRGNTIDANEIAKWAAQSEDDGTSMRTSWEQSADDDQGEHQGLLTPPQSPRSHPTADQPTSSVGFFSVLRHPDHWQAVVGVLGVMLAQQLTGINSVFFYSVDFLSLVIPTGAALITVTVGALNLVVTIACSPLSDKLGRKPCLLVSIAGMGVNSVLLGCAIMFNIQILAAIATLAFVASFAVGLGPVPFILASELASPEAAGAVQSWALAANWIATFLVAQFFPPLNRALDHGRVFFVFAAMAAAFFAFTLWWIPESKGKKDADEVWGREPRRAD